MRERGGGGAAVYHTAQGTLVKSLESQNRPEITKSFVHVFILGNFGEPILVDIALFLREKLILRSRGWDP